MNVQSCPCGKPAETLFVHLGPLCKECFTNVILRRVRKALKDAGWLKPQQKVHLLLDESKQGKAIETLFKQTIKGLPLQYGPAEQSDVCIIGKTADDEAEDFLNQLFAGKLKAPEKTINIFANVSTAEIEKYCELGGITGMPRQKSELRTRLEALEQRYPGTMFSLKKSQHSFRDSSE